jgi:gas vesicle protein
MYRLKYVGIALVAGTVGAAVALLLAPDSGVNTRRKMKKRLDRERALLAKRLEHERALLAKRSRKVLEQAEDYLEDQVKEGRKIAEGVAEEVTDRLEAGKRKLTRLVR